eukprot:Selendium_serpulae@DN5955_c1_g1_i12.p1
MCHTWVVLLVCSKKGDWPCTHCGNVNWARRDKCNICQAPKPNNNEEPRMGKGGGHFDLQDPEDRNKFDSSDEEFDEFGRKKRRKKYRYPSSSRPKGGSADYSEAMPRDLASYDHPTDIKMVFPPAPPLRRKDRRAPSTSSGESGSESDSDDNTNNRDGQREKEAGGAGGGHERSRDPSYHDSSHRREKERACDWSRDKSSRDAKQHRDDDRFRAFHSY